MSNTDTWITSFGKLDFSRNGFRMLVSQDLIRFYKSLVDKEFKIFTNLPAHGAHVSILLPNIHNIDNNAAQRVKALYKNKPIAFKYNPNIVVGIGRKKNFANFWMKVKSDDLDFIAKELNIQQNWHITISNTKSGVRPYIWETPKINKDLKPN